jgi:hypothetical protein
MVGMTADYSDAQDASTWMAGVLKLQQRKLEWSGECGSSSSSREQSVLEKVQCRAA